MKRIIWTTVCIVGAVISASATETTLSADDIVSRANQAMYYSGEDRRVETRMLIVDGQGRTQKRQFNALRRDVSDGGGQEMLVVFSQPSDVRGTVYLVKKYPGQQDDRWLYLPGLDLVKRISAGDKRTSFIGAHAFYEDVSGRWTQEDIHEIIEATAEHYVLKHTPRDPSTVEFADYITWIDKDTFLPMKIEYRNRSGKVYRRVEALQVDKVQDHPTVTFARVSDLETGGKTEIKLRWAEYDQGLPQSIFSERSLRNPPSDWLQPASVN